MTKAILGIIAALGAVTVVTCFLIVAMELHQATAMRAMAERRLLEVKLELRKLLKAMKEK